MAVFPLNDIFLGHPVHCNYLLQCVGLHEPQLVLEARVLVGHLEVEHEAASFLQRELRCVLPPNQPYIVHYHNNDFANNPFNITISVTRCWSCS